MSISTNENASARPAWVYLDAKYNPSQDESLATVPEDRLCEACGIIPDFFMWALVEGIESVFGPTLERVSDAMDKAYGFGGFCYPFKGTVSAEGVYQSPYDDDEPLAPLLRLSHSGLELYIYESAIAALRDCTSGEVVVGRFD